MIVGSLRIRLLVREALNLKDKRQVIRSIKDRLCNGFNISIAEVEAQDHRQLAVLGIALVGTEARDVRSTLDRIVEAVRCHPVAELLDYEVDV